MKPSLPAIAAAAVALGVACSVSVVRRGELDAARAERIVAGIQKLRGLSFERPVPMKVTDPEGVREYLREELDREYGPAEIAALARVYTELGLLPSDVDLASALLRLYSAQIAGFYDPRARTLFLVDPPPDVGGSWLLTALQWVLRRDLVGEMLLAHELTHALQDQNFDVLSRVSGGLNDDAALAAAAVVEGDATLAGFAYLFGGLPESTLLALVEQLRGIPGEVEKMLPETPAVLREALVFRYNEGARFVAWAYLAEGWEGVNAVLASPPRSTEQVLWPEKYFIDVDDPVTVSLGGLDRYVDDPGWSLVEENTLGELMIRVLLEQHLGRDRAEWVARGWDGDRFSAWARDGETHVVWMTVWDSVRDAKDFFAAKAEILGLAPEKTAQRSWVAATAPRPACLERRDGRVLLLLGVGPGACEPLAEEVWKETGVTPPESPLLLDLAGRKKPRMDTN